MKYKKVKGKKYYKITYYWDFWKKKSQVSLVGDYITFSLKDCMRVNNLEGYIEGEVSYML